MEKKKQVNFLNQELVYTCSEVTIIGQLSSKEQLLLISVGDNIAHQGAIKASEIWQFNWKDLDKIRDGAFFDTAKRIK